MNGWFDPAAGALLAFLAGGLALTAILCYLPDKGRSEIGEDLSGLSRGEWRWGKFSVKVEPSGPSPKIRPAGDAPGAPVTVLRLELRLAGPAQAVWFDPAGCRLEGSGWTKDALAPSSIRLVSFSPSHLPEELALRGTIYGQGASRVYELRFDCVKGARRRLRLPVYDQVFDLELRPSLEFPATSSRPAGETPGAGAWR